MKPVYRKSSPRTWGCFSVYAVSVGGLMSSPRTWGCFQPVKISLFDATVFPTHVGVFLLRSSEEVAAMSLPHARGGVSRKRPGANNRLRSSPRTWGCFRCAACLKVGTFVFPTHVGVFLAQGPQGLGRVGLPHARGGVSFAKELFMVALMSSPRTWGCFQVTFGILLTQKVFPTHVGVFLVLEEIPVSPLGLPHARGGVSRKRAIILRCKESSPRTWGCFPCSSVDAVLTRVFPTHVGVFPHHRPQGRL